MRTRTVSAILGPFVLAALMALSQGSTSVFLVIGFSTLLQQFESNVVIPRIMSHAIGLSSLVGLFAVLAGGTLYGILGVFVAIPLTVVLQVLLNHMVINPEPVPEAPTFVPQPLVTLRTRIQTLQQRVRACLRGRTTRMATTTKTPDQVADTVDQRMEQAVERVETLVAAAQKETEALDPEIRRTLVEELQQVTRQIDKAVQRLETIMPPSGDEGQASSRRPLEPSVLAEVQQATQKVEEAVQHIASVLIERQDQDTASPEQGKTPYDSKRE